MRYKTTTRLNLRAEPGGQVVRVLAANTTIARLPLEAVSANNTTWWAVLASDRQTLGWCASQFLRPDSPQRGRRSTFGLHYYPYGADLNGLYSLAEQGLLVGVTVVNDYTVANRLVGLGVPYVVYRAGVDGTEYAPEITGTEKDIEIGLNWFFHPRYWTDNQRTDPRVILQVGNEFGLNEELPNYDAYFWEGVIQAADSVGRRVCIFNDFCGTPKMWFDQGRYHSPAWMKRTRALRACLYDQSGRLRTEPHFVGIHAYSRPGPKLASDPHEWEWGAGYFVGLYSTVPQYQPPILLTEYGSHDADVTAMPEGLQSVVKDIRDSLPILERYPTVKAFMYWTLGQWRKSSIDAALPQIAGVVRAYLEA